MGDNFLRRQIKNFEKGRDRAIAESKQPTLYIRPEVVKTVYSIKPVAGERFTKGETLYVVAGDNGDQLAVARGHKRVGIIDGDGAKELRAALNEASSTRVARLCVDDTLGLSGVARARVTEDGNQHG